MSKIPVLNINTQASGTPGVANTAAADSAIAQTQQSNNNAIASAFGSAAQVAKLRRDRNEQNLAKMDVSDFLQEASSPANREEYLKTSKTGSMEGFSDFMLKKMQKKSAELLNKYSSPQVRERLAGDLQFQQNRTFVKAQAEEIRESRELQNQADQVAVSSLVQITDQMDLDGLGDAMINAEVTKFAKDMLAEVDDGTRSMSEAKQVVRSATDMVFLRRVKALAEEGKAGQAMSIATNTGIFSDKRVAARALDAAKNSSINSLKKRVQESNMQEALIRNQRAVQSRKYFQTQSELLLKFDGGEISLDQLNQAFTDVNKDFIEVADIAASNRYKKGTVEQNLAKFKARASVIRDDETSTIDDLQEQMSELSLVLRDKTLPPSLVNTISSELKKTRVEISKRARKEYKDTYNETFLKSQAMLKDLYQRETGDPFPSKSKLKDFFNTKIVDTAGDFEDPKTVRKTYLKMLSRNKEAAQLSYKTQIHNQFKGIVSDQKISQVLASGKDESQITEALIKGLHNPKVFNKYLDESESFWHLEGWEKEQAKKSIERAKDEMRIAIGSYFDSIEVLKAERKRLGEGLAGE